MIPIFKTPQELINYRSANNWSQKRIGFVPTMGALHEGHASLMKQARLENDIVVASIFVNPTQFNDPEDLKKYPRTLEKDLEILKRNGVDFLFHPEFAAMYPDQYKYKLSESELSNKLCGAHRPGHFDGVLSIVMKLFNIVRPNRAYFGEKDYQQLMLIEGMAEAFFMDVKVVPCPTVREVDGLAMSSRNLLLAPEERARAPRFSAALNEEANAESARRRLEEEGFRVDYVEDMGGRRLGAVHLGRVRLIDNVAR